MKRFLKIPSCLAFFASWALSHVAHAQFNTQTYYAELNNADRRDVAVPTPYTPYGNKTDLNRYGDDGSAAILEASGMVLWRTSDGVYRAIANTVYAKPLFVSNSECIVWRNAYDPNIAVAPAVQMIQLSYFRVDFASGSLRETSVSVEGNKVLDTPTITTTSSPYTLVTTNVASLPAVTNAHTPANLFVYRLTSNPATPQLLSVSTYGNEYLTEGADTIAVSADGSQVVRFRDGGSRYFWVRNDGSIKEIVIADPVPLIRPVEISAVRFVFGLARYDLNGAATSTTLFNYSRDANTDALQVQPTIGLAFPVGVTTGEVISLPNFNQKGVEPVFVTQDRNLATATSNLCVFRLSGNLATFLYKATIPLGLGMDTVVTRINATPGSESIALRDQTNHGIIWLHNGPGYDQWEQLATVNFTRLSRSKSAVVPAWATDPSPVTNDMTWGHPMFVTPGEVVVWQNALTAVLPNGAMPPVMVKHYGRDATTGALTITEVKVVADATDPNAIYPGPLRGTQVFAPFPFTQDPALWMLETGEKLTGNSLRVRRYELLNPTNADADGDGIPGGLELGPFYVVPGSFTYDEAVKDAKRRGGHLATFGSTAEFSRMQTGIGVQQRSGPMALPELTIPYPLWIGLELDTATSTWKWADASNPALLVLPPDPSSRWGLGEPSALASRTRGRLTSTQQWESINPFNRGSYLLELTLTDPLAKDTDGDGASDYDELFRLITDPTVPNFGAGPPMPVTFASASVFGNYEGFVPQFAKGPISSFTLSVTKTGAYTGKINGVAGTPSIRGTFSSTGAVTALPVGIGPGLNATLSMIIAPDPITGKYRVSGQLTGLNGDPLVFELRRPAYAKTIPTLDAGLYTIAIPADKLPKEGQPNGDGYLTGSITLAGVATFRGKTSDGMPISWSGNLLEGDFLSFYSLLPSSGGFVGSNLFVRDSAVVDDIYGLVGQSDLDGDLRVTRKAVTSGSAQIAGYDFHSGAYGSIYQAVSYAQLLAFSDFTATQSNNALIKFIDGAFSGQDVISTWTTKNIITVPKTQTRTLSATIKTASGELTGTCQYNDPTQIYASTKGTLAGVVLQKSGEVRGYYTAGTGSGQMLMLPNLDGTPAPVTLISPKLKNISEEGGTYKIYVTASEPWTVANSEAWVVVFPMSGTGNAELVVTVAKNPTNLRRQTDLTIAGLNHHINQDWNRNAAGIVTISPTARLVTAAGLTYTVTITGLRAGSTAEFSSPVPWVVVTPDAAVPPGGVPSATVVVAPYITLLDVPRTTVVTIAGLPHTIVQSAPIIFGP